MSFFSKSYVLVATAILLAVASYCIAWLNIQSIKKERFIQAQTEDSIVDKTPVVDTVKELLDSPELYQQPLTQKEVSTTVTALNLAIETLSDLPKWIENSKAVPLDPSKTYISIVIDDVGVVDDRSVRVVNELPKEITLAFLPYGESTKVLFEEAYKKGHELMIHLPMEAHEGKNGYIANPGEGALYTSVELSDIENLVRANFSGLADRVVGVNNHMGSKFTEWAEGLNEVFKVVESEEMFFLDSLTTAHSKASEMIQNYNIPFLKRDVFLDHEIEEDKIMQALGKVERIAKANGSAIAIGHPHTETINVLNKWVKTLKSKNIQLVPITALIKEK